MKDQFNRQIDYIRISVTEKCNYNCLYCKPEKSSFEAPQLLTDDEIMQIVFASSKLGIHKVRLTGGEPLLRKGIVELIQNIKRIEGIDEVVLTTNGALLHSMLDDLYQAGLNRVNISLDSLDSSKFKYITNGGNLSEVLKGIDKLIELGMKPVKVNVVLMKGFNEDEVSRFVNLTRDKEIIVRFIELMPIGSHEFPFDKYYLSNEEVLKNYPEFIECDYPKHETAKYYKLPNGKGKIGFISAVSHHFCGNCNRIRITSDGKVKPCLHSNKEFDLLDFMRNQKGSVEDFLKQCIVYKPKSHKLNQDDFEKVRRSMYRIGG